MPLPWGQDVSDEDNNKRGRTGLEEEDTVPQGDPGYLAYILIASVLNHHPLDAWPPISYSTSTDNGGFIIKLDIVSVV